MPYVHPIDEEHEWLLLCWTMRPVGNAVPNRVDKLNGDQVDELRERAQRIFNAGTFAYIQLVRWNYDTESYSIVANEWGD